MHIVLNSYTTILRWTSVSVLCRDFTYHKRILTELHHIKGKTIYIKCINTGFKLKGFILMEYVVKVLLCIRAVPVNTVSLRRRVPGADAHRNAHQPQKIHRVRDIMLFKRINTSAMFCFARWRRKYKGALLQCENRWNTSDSVHLNNKFVWIFSRNCRGKKPGEMCAHSALSIRDPSHAPQRSDNQWKQESFIFDTPLTMIEANGPWQINQCFSFMDILLF